MATFPKVRLSTVEIPVSNLDRASTWYCSVFHMDITWSDQFHTLLESPKNKAEVLDLGVKVLLVKTTSPQRLNINNSNTGIIHSVLDIETDDLSGLYEVLSSRKVVLTPLADPVYDWAPRGFPFHDSEGNLFGVYCYR